MTFLLLLLRKTILATAVAAALSAITTITFVADAALPPGYEDNMWCPEGYCDMPVTTNPTGFVGPSSAFHECYDSSTNTTVDEVWTGSLSDTVVPEGWIEFPDECPEEYHNGTNEEEQREELLPLELPDVDNNILEDETEEGLVLPTNNDTGDEATASDLVDNEEEENSAAAATSGMQLTFGRAVSVAGIAPLAAQTLLWVL